MKQLVELTPAARADLEAIYAQLLAGAGRGTADQFFAAIRHWRGQIALHPEMGRPRKFRRPELSELRSLNCGGRFSNYLIFYHLARGNPVIIRVIHGARDLESALLEPFGE